MSASTTVQAGVAGAPTKPTRRRELDVIGMGIVSLLGGVGELLGLHSLGDALFWIILGAYLIVKPWFDKRKLFGKVEDS